MVVRPLTASNSSHFSSSSRSASGIISCRHRRLPGPPFPSVQTGRRPSICTQANHFHLRTHGYKPSSPTAQSNRITSNGQHIRHHTRDHATSHVEQQQRQQHQQRQHPGVAINHLLISPFVLLAPPPDVPAQGRRHGLRMQNRQRQQHHFGKILPLPPSIILPNQKIGGARRPRRHQPPGLAPARCSDQNNVQHRLPQEQALLGAPARLVANDDELQAPEQERV
ncbi:hypothetical protein IWZ01DRAFT_115985 [Phyllosticta capitalensis]